MRVLRSSGKCTNLSRRPRRQSTLASTSFDGRAGGRVNPEEHLTMATAMCREIGTGFGLAQAEVELQELG